jgi:hypothetical protein
MKKLISAAMIACAFGAEAMIPGGIDKKYVGVLFDVIETSPSNVLANADQFAEQAPYLDGVALALQEVHVVSSDGGVATSKYTRIMHPTERWTHDSVKDQIPILKAISQKSNLAESFLLFWLTPNMKENRLDWRDDKAWANFAENMATVAWLAKEGGMKGLMIDPEEYALAMQYIHMPQDPPFQECAKLARQRGREVFSRVFQEFPDAVIFSLWFFNHFAWWMENGRQTNPTIYADDSGELSQYFYNGMIDAMPPEARAVDGGERYTGSATQHAFHTDATRQTSAALAFVAPENWVKYRSQFFVGNTHYLDMYTQGANPKSTWYWGPIDGSRLEHMRLNLEESLYSATKYIWIYGERGGKLFDWRGGHFAGKKTWEEVIPGMTETMMLAKDPERFSAMRKAELKSSKQLVNLAADVKPFKFENPGGIREFSQPEDEMPSLRDVKPGERYRVSVFLEARKGSMSRVHSGAVRLRVFWRKNGKRISAKPVPLAFSDEDTTKWTKAEAVVTVPNGADELVLDRSAALAAGERIRYDRVSVHNVSETLTPAEAKRERLPRVGPVGFNHKPCLEIRPEEEISIKGLKPGELYSVEVSMKRRGAGLAFINLRFRGNGESIPSFKKVVAMNSPVKDNVWRSGEAVVRVPDGADELYFDFYCELYEGGRFEFDKFKVYKIGDPLPVWPAEALREPER